MKNIQLMIFDADGTLRNCTVPGQYFPLRSGEWVLRPQVKEKFASIDWGDVGFGVASNQSGVHLGMLSELMARELLIDMAREAFSGISDMETAFRPHIPKPFIQLCPHDPKGVCACRKPMPGMLRRIMSFYDVRPENTLFVGNADTDMQAATNAGCLFSWESEFFR